MTIPDSDDPELVVPADTLSARTSEPDLGPILDQISVYLLDDVDEYADALRRPEDLVPYPLDGAHGLDGALYVSSPQLRIPTWVRFAEQLSGRGFGYLGNQHLSAVLFLRREGSLFALTFGFGRHHLRPEKVVSDYGLKVAAGLIDPEQISSLDSRAFEATVLQVRRQSNRGIGAGAIGFDIGREMLRALAGQLKEASIGTRITGSDSVGLSAKLDVSTLGDRVDQLHAAYRKGLYRDNAFKHIDRWQQLRATDDDAADLDRELEDALVSRWQAFRDGLEPAANPESFARPSEVPQLSAPEVIEYQASGFRVDLEPNDALHAFPDLDVYLRVMRKAPSLNDLRHNHRLYVIGGDANEPTGSWPLYKSMTWERNVGNETFVLAEGSWWRVDADYRQQVNDAALAIPTSNLSCPAFDLEEWEVDYNQRLRDHAPADRALIDRATVKFAHESGRVEPCDIFTADGEFVHVKRGWLGSETLSHLLAQGYVSARLFGRSREFRAFLRGQLGGNARLIRLTGDDHPDTRRFTVTFGIATHRQNPDATTLPFFARNLLVQIAPQIQEMGYRLELLWIPVEEGARPTGLGPTAKQVAIEKRRAAPAASPDPVGPSTRGRR